MCRPKRLPIVRVSNTPNFWPTPQILNLVEPLRQLDVVSVVLERHGAGEGAQVGDVVALGVVAELCKQPAGQVVEQHGRMHVLPALGQVGTRLVHRCQLGFIGQGVELVEGHTDSLAPLGFGIRG